MTPRGTSGLVATDPKRSGLMRRVRRINTKPELEVRKLLHELDIHYSLHGKGLPETPDILNRGDGFESSGERTILTAPGPAKIVRGSDFSNRSIALCITAKYADGIPFARVEKILERSGLEMSRTTLANLMMSTSRLSL